MKQEKHIEEALRIGKSSWALMNFDQLPKRASKKAQIAALLVDKRWQDDPANEVAKRIDRLIGEIEQTSPTHP